MVMLRLSRWCSVSPTLIRESLLTFTGAYGVFEGCDDVKDVPKTNQWCLQVSAPTNNQGGNNHQTEAVGLMLMVDST